MVTFFEIKSKCSNNMTNKHRLERAFGDDSFGPAERAMVARYTGLPADELEPAMTMDFVRITLLGKHSEERTTVDIDVDFDGAGPAGNLRRVAIVEVKQAQLDRTTPIMKALRAHGIRPCAHSKYCTALALSQRVARTNAVRPTLRMLERLQK
jgi:hypothetical protein